jgi:DNA repair exonuclease SbcCD ATPase subunit
MSTTPSNAGTNSDFLQLEPIGAHHSPETAAEHWDIDEELNSLLAIAGSQESAEPAAANAGQVAQLAQSIAVMQNELAASKQSQAEKLQAIEHSTGQANKLQQRTEQLAKYSKLQIRQMQEMIQSFEMIRQEIVASLDRFGHYEQLEPMLQKILAADLSLRQANEKLQAHQSDLYESLQVVQKQVEARSNVAEQNLQQSHTEFTKLLETIRSDRERTVALQAMISQHFQEAQQLQGSLQGLQEGLTVKSTQLATDFTDLTESIQHEKQQFYQLTAEMINKTDAMRSQFAEIANQVDKDWKAIQSLQFKVDDLHNTLDNESKQQSFQLNQRYDELVSSWGDLKQKQAKIDRQQQTYQVWLRGLGIILGITLLMLIGLIWKVAR